jgi:Bacterial archaeo-eukaryotic release factor family 3
MKTKVSPEIMEIIEATHYRPAISIMMPFDPKISLITELGHSLKIACDKVKQELIQNYPEEMVVFMMQKLNTIIEYLNFDTQRKSIAIYISPVFDKVMYLDIHVKEKIIINESFAIRDLIYNKKQTQAFLVLLLSGKESRLYLCNSGTFFVRILSQTPENIDAYKNDLPEKVLNFSDVSQRKEIIMEKFFLHIDKELDSVINAYHLPIMVLGTERIVGHFKKLTKHSGAIVEYIHGNYDDANSDQMKEILEPHLHVLNEIKQKDLLKQLENAAGQKKLTIGIKDVWREAAHQKGRLLVVEKNFTFTAQLGSDESKIFKPTEPYHSFSYIKDAVDDVIEKVLEYGGDVEFVDDGVLQAYKHIALIQYY